MADDQKNVYVLGEGTVLNGHFQVEEVLGAGGFGITYRALDKHLDRVVAIKEFYPGAWVSRNTTYSATVTPISTQHGLLFTSMKEKFIEEAKAMARLDFSTHVVKVFSYFEENGTAYIVMEYLDGVTLRKHVEKHGKMDPDELCRLMIPLIRALNVVHSYKLIHRDIAPDNIMLMPDRTLKLLDFGAARSFSEDTNKSMSVILKHGFAPIEQYQRRGNQGAWTDIYALSATMYYCVTGIIPESAVDRITNDSLRRPSEMGITIRPAIEDALMKGMAKLAEERYQTAMDMAAAFDAVKLGIWSKQKGGPGGTVVVEGEIEEKIDKKSNFDRPKKEEVEKENDKKKLTEKNNDRSFFSRLISKLQRAKWLIALVMIIVIGVSGFAILDKIMQNKPPETTSTSYIPGETASIGALVASILPSELPTNPSASRSPYVLINTPESKPADKPSVKPVATSAASLVPTLTVLPLLTLTSPPTPTPTSPPTPTPTSPPTPTPTAPPTPTPTAPPTPTPTAPPTPTPTSPPTPTPTSPPTLIPTAQPKPPATMRIIPPEINNLANGGMMVRDAQRFYTQHTGKNSRFCLYQVRSDFGLGPAAMDQMRTDAKYSLFNNRLYFYSKSDGKVGLYAYEMKNGVVSGEPMRIAAQNTLQYAIDNQGLYYATDGINGIWRVDHYGNGKTKLSPHSVRSSNNVVRMIPYDNKLYYINSKDNCLYNVPTSGISEPMRLSNEGLHYFIFAEYNGEVIIIYVTYAKSDNLNYSTLRAISLDGSPIPGLDGLSDMQSRYINYLDGWLYYADSAQSKYLMAVPLDNLSAKTLLLSVPVGYIHAFDGWITALPLESNERYFIDARDWHVYIQPALY